MCPLARESYALDVGAGSGTLAACIVRTNKETRVLATDISQGMLDEIAKRQLPNVTTQIEDAVSLSGIKDNTFSHAFTSFAIQFTPDPLACVESLHRVLVPGGVVGIAVWGKDTDISTAHNAACKRLDPDYVPALPATSGAWFDRNEHQNILHKVGFKYVKTETIQMPVEFKDAKGACDYW